MNEEVPSEVPQEPQEFGIDHFDIAHEEPGESAGQNLEASVQPSEEAPADGESIPPTPPSSDGEGDASPEDDLEKLREQLAAANAELLQYRGIQSTSPQEKSTPPTQQPQEPAKFDIPKTADEVTNVDFLGDGDHVDILGDAAKFNALLNKVATVAFNAAVTASQERILRQIPAVVETAASQQLRIRDIVERFYSSNKDLEAYRPAVAMAATKLHNEQPQMMLEELLAKAAEKTRETLRIRPGVAPRQRKPAQPSGAGRVGGDRMSTPPEISDQEKQILALLSDF